jgi:Glyoxalase superfamily protein
MSRDLPPRPHLDHLRKQAKELLQTLQQQDPRSRLADAQHAIARQYGFSSWPRLKAHVAREAATAPNPFVGNWTADLSRSRLHPLNQLRCATIAFDVAGDTVTINYVMVEPSGHTERGVNTFVADGNERPSMIREGYVMRARWLGSHGLEAVVSRNGEFEGRVDYAVSSDGRTLTLSAKGGPGGVEQVGVFERDAL